jgi:Ca2+-binding RTX toxin-like protein
VQSSVSYSLGSFVENLTITVSTNNITATGNGLDNILIGGSGSNTLTGNAGNDTLNGMGGNDTMIGGQGNDIYFMDVSTDVTTEAANEGIDTINAAFSKALIANFEALFLTGTGNNTATGLSTANLLRGNSGMNTLTGAGGTDILEGGDGVDTLTNSGANTLYNGGLGADILQGTANNDLFIGGADGDTITTGTGADIIAFNLGSGQDTASASTVKDNVVSLGGGARYADLLFQKTGNNLILKVGGSDQITFTDFYAGTHSVDKLQIVIEGTTDYDAGSSDDMRNKKIETFDFDAMVAEFDAARVVDPSLTSWALTNKLALHRLSGSDTAAIGGDLAYRYNRFGSLSDISFSPAQAILSAGTFGTGAQALQSLASLQDASPRLS